VVLTKEVGLRNWNPVLSNGMWLKKMDLFLSNEMGCREPLVPDRFSKYMFQPPRQVQYIPPNRGMRLEDYTVLQLTGS
jgi:hypothetical protein